MSKHTPGPWSLQECSNGGALLIRGLYGKHQQSHLQIVPIEDARLIAAAPELLEALKAVMPSLHLTPDYNRLAKLAHAAIAKAEGQ